MALVIDVTYSKTSEAKSYVYKDANFKNIENALPKLVKFGSSSIITYNSKRGIKSTEDQRTARKVFTSSGRRYDIYAYDIDGQFISLERILKSEGITSGTDLGGDWTMSYSSLITMQENSLFDRSAIKNSIKNLFMFHLRERIILPDFGNCLDDIIGSPMTNGQLIVTKEMVEKMMGWERRIDVNDVNVTQNIDEHEVLIEIKYSIPVLKVTSESLSFLIKVSDI